MELGLLRVRTGCRLHFGLMELAEGESHRYAGLGMMVSAPAMELAFSPIVPGRSLEVVVPPGADACELERRIREVAVLHSRPVVPADIGCRIEISQALPLHSGLGCGTQLACAVATGLELLDLALAERLESGEGSDWRVIAASAPHIDRGWLVHHTSRGLRSAVGLHGFVHGGMILDAGYNLRTGHSNPRPVDTRSAVPPPDWRIVLVLPSRAQHVSGSYEAELLAEIGQNPNPAREEMFSLAQQLLETAGADPRFAYFCQLLEDYMRLAARMFAGPQGGPYNGPQVAAAVDLCRKAGLRAVGQSSWGPTVFGFACDEECAHRAAAKIRDASTGCSIVVASAASSGAQWNASSQSN